MKSTVCMNTGGGGLLSTKQPGVCVCVCSSQFVLYPSLMYMFVDPYTNRNIFTRNVLENKPISCAVKGRGVFNYVKQASEVHKTTTKPGKFYKGGGVTSDLTSPIARRGILC